MAYYLNFVQRKAMARTFRPLYKLFGKLWSWRHFYWISWIHCYYIKGILHSIILYVQIYDWFMILDVKSLSFRLDIERCQNYLWSHSWSNAWSLHFFLSKNEQSTKCAYDYYLSMENYRVSKCLCNSCFLAQIQIQNLHFWIIYRNTSPHA
jgi:hypothetical protein